MKEIKLQYKKQRMNSAATSLRSSLGGTNKVLSLPEIGHLPRFTSQVTQFDEAGDQPVESEFYENMEQEGNSFDSDESYDS